MKRIKKLLILTLVLCMVLTDLPVMTQAEGPEVVEAVNEAVLPETEESMIGDAVTQVEAIEGTTVPNEEESEQAKVSILETGVQSAKTATYNSGNSRSIEEGSANGECYFDTFEDLQQLCTGAYDYSSFCSRGNTLVISQDLTLPSNCMLEHAGTIIVNKGVTLTISDGAYLETGTMIINGSYIARGQTVIRTDLEVNGGIALYGYMILQDPATVSGSRNISFMGERGYFDILRHIETFAEIKAVLEQAALDDPRIGYVVFWEHLEDVVLEESLTVPSNVEVHPSDTWDEPVPSANLIIPEGVTLEIYGSLHARGIGETDFENGYYYYHLFNDVTVHGTIINNGHLCADSVTVTNTGSYSGKGDIYHLTDNPGETPSDWLMGLDLSKFELQVDNQVDKCGFNIYQWRLSANSDQSIELSIPEEEICTDPMICGTVIDSDGQPAMMPTILGSSDVPYYNVQMDFTLPEGFSFSETELDGDMQYVGDWIELESGFTMEPIYPIYIDPQNQKEEYAIAVTITATEETGNTTTSSQDLVFYIPESNDNVAEPACPNIKGADDYTFSLSSAAGSGTTYNQETARLCAMMADMAYDRDGMEKFLVEEMGFSNFERDGVFIDMDNTGQECGRYYASKKVIQDGEIKNLVYVVCRGTPGLPREWLSNLMAVGETSLGFLSAAQFVEQDLIEYCKKHSFAIDDTILVLTGHSRGAAAANIVGNWLNTSAGLAQKENISVYTFATPTVNKTVASETTGYVGNENIFNFVNYQDVIRNAPSMQYYGRYGSTRIFAYHIAEAGATELFDGYGTYPLPNNGTNYTLNEMFSSVLYDCDTSSPLSVGKAVFAVANLLKKRVSLFDSGLEEVLTAHLMPIYYNAVVNDAPASSVDEVNRRTKEVNEFVWAWYENMGNALKDFIMYSYKCPINLYVYDADGNIAASIVDKHVTCNDDTLMVYMNGNSLNVGCFEDEWDGYTIQIEGYDNGTMKHCVQTIGIDAIESVQVREDIPITDGGVLKVNSGGYVQLDGENDTAASSTYAKYEDKEEIEEVLESLAHTYIYAVETVPTLDAEGLLVGTCTRCDEKVKVVLPKLSKTAYTLEVITEPTDEANGLGRYTWNVTDYGTFTFEAEIPNTVPGDVNGDDKINVLDLMYLANHFAKGETINKANADVNADGTVDVRDLMFLANVFAGKETLG